MDNSLKLGQWEMKVGENVWILLSHKTAYLRDINMLLVIKYGIVGM